MTGEQKLIKEWSLVDMLLSGSSTWPRFCSTEAPLPVSSNKEGWKGLALNRSPRAQPPF